MKKQDREPLLSLEEQLAVLAADVPPAPADFHARWTEQIRQEAGREAGRDHPESAGAEGLRESVGREVSRDHTEDARVGGLSKNVGGESRKASEAGGTLMGRETRKAQWSEPVTPGRWRRLAGIAAALIVLVGGAAVFRAQRLQPVSLKMDLRIQEPEETEEAEKTEEAADQAVFQADNSETETDGAVFSEGSTASPTAPATVIPDAIAMGGISNVMDPGRKSAEKAVEQAEGEAPEAAEAEESGSLPEMAASGAPELFAEAADRMEETEEAEEDAAFADAGAEDLPNAAESESMEEAAEESAEGAEMEAAEESPDTEPAAEETNGMEDNRSSWLWAAAFLAAAIGCGLLERHRRMRK